MKYIKHLWRIFLRRIPFEKEGTRCIAEVDLIHEPVDIPRIARQIIESGSEFQYETIVNIASQYEEMIFENIMKGRRVHTPNLYILPRVNGVWRHKHAKYDPDEHQATISVVPSARLREELRTVELDVLGSRNNSAHISRIIDDITQQRDNTVTSGDIITLEGTNIKITDEDPDTGIFFVHPDGTETMVKHRLIFNEPKRLVSYVPRELAPGEYQVIVRTRYTPGGTKKCKTLKTIVYPHPVTVCLPPTGANAEG